MTHLLILPKELHQLQNKHSNINLSEQFTFKLPHTMNNLLILFIYLFFAYLLYPNHSFLFLLFSPLLPSDPLLLDHINIGWGNPMWIKYVPKADKEAETDLALTVKSPKRTASCTVITYTQRCLVRLTQTPCLLLQFLLSPTRPG